MWGILVGTHRGCQSRTGKVPALVGKGKGSIHLIVTKVQAGYGVSMSTATIRGLKSDTNA